MPTLDQAIKNALHDLRHSDGNAGMCHCAAEELEAAWSAECDDRRCGGRKFPRDMLCALAGIFDVLYLDVDEDDEEYYNPNKQWESDMLDRVSEIVRPFFADRFPKEGE